MRDGDATGEPVLVLGGGSNLVVADEGFPGTVVHVATSGVRIVADHDGVTVGVAAGEDWDSLVERCVAEGLSGIECLSGIPGLAGATPIQNVGAYGQEVSGTVDRGAGLRPAARHGRHARERRLWLRVPDERVQAQTGGRPGRRGRCARWTRPPRPGGSSCSA